MHLLQTDISSLIFSFQEKHSHSFARCQSIYSQSKGSQTARIKANVAITCKQNTEENKTTKDNSPVVKAKENIREHISYQREVGGGGEIWFRRYLDNGDATLAWFAASRLKCLLHGLAS